METEAAIVDVGIPSSLIGSTEVHGQSVCERAFLFLALVSDILVPRQSFSGRHAGLRVGSMCSHTYGWVFPR